MKTPCKSEQLVYQLSPFKMFPKKKSLKQVKSKQSCETIETSISASLSSINRLNLKQQGIRYNAYLNSLLMLIIFVNHFAASSNQQSPVNTGNINKKQPLEMRESFNYSPNNRGILPVNLSIQSNQAQDSLWIPIVLPSTRKSQAHQLKLSQVAQAGNAQAIHAKQTTAAAAAAKPRKVSNNLKEGPIAAESVHLHLKPKQHLLYGLPSDQYPQQGVRISATSTYQPHQHSFSGHSNSNNKNNIRISHNTNARWRMPRFKDLQPSSTSKMYKRVLLCDKTLVSLDYVRNIEPEPRPFSKQYHHHHHLHDPDFLDDNFIDLDDAALASSSVLSSRQPPPPPPSHENKTTSISPSTSTHSSGIHAEVAASSRSYLSRRSVERRSYLNDEDPLVKCDMWDLEKGLKNRKPPREILQMAIRADFDTVRDAINRCRQLTEKTLISDDEYRDGLEVMSAEDFVSLFSMKRGLIPGTKWCGLGDQASTYNDLGPKHRIDVCCRAHDHCPIRLKPFRNDYGVLNIALYTKSHCDCDADFYRCLREVHSRTADMLGNLYFNVMKLQCLREERMKICREMKHVALGFERCVKYEESPIKTVFKFTTPPVAY